MRGNGCTHDLGVDIPRATAQVRYAQDAAASLPYARSANTRDEHTQNWEVRVRIVNLLDETYILQNRVQTIVYVERLLADVLQGLSVGLPGVKLEGHV